MPGWGALCRAAGPKPSPNPNPNPNLHPHPRCNLSFGLRDSEAGLVGPMAAVADIDGDGRLDVAVTDGGSRVMLFANRAGGDRPWVRLTLCSPSPSP